MVELNWACEATMKCTNLQLWWWPLKKWWDMEKLGFSLKAKSLYIILHILFTVIMRRYGITEDISPQMICLVCFGNRVTEKEKRKSTIHFKLK